MNSLDTFTEWMQGVIHQDLHGMILQPTNNPLKPFKAVSNLYPETGQTENYSQSQELAIRNEGDPLPRNHVEIDPKKFQLSISNCITNIENIKKHKLNPDKNLLRDIEKLADILQENTQVLHYQSPLVDSSIEKIRGLATEILVVESGDDFLISTTEQLFSTLEKFCGDLKSRESIDKGVKSYCIIKNIFSDEKFLNLINSTYSKQRLKDAGYQILKADLKHYPQSENFILNTELILSTFINESEELALNFQDLEHLPKSLGMLTSLKKLDLSCCQSLFMPQEITHLSLTELKISSNLLSSLSSLKFKNLQNVSLNLVLGDFSSIKQKLKLLYQEARCVNLKIFIEEKVGIPRKLIEKFLNFDDFVLRLNLWRLFCNNRNIRNNSESMILLLNLSEEERGKIEDWLIYLATIGDFKISQRQVATIVCEILTVVANDKDCKKLFFEYLQTDYQQSDTETLIQKLNPLHEPCKKCLLGLIARAVIFY